MIRYVANWWFVCAKSASSHSAWPKKKKIRAQIEKTNLGQGL